MSVASRMNIGILGSELRRGDGDIDLDSCRSPRLEFLEGLDLANVDDVAILGVRIRADVLDASRTERGRRRCPSCR